MINLELIKTRYPKAFDKMKIWGKDMLTKSVGLPITMADSFPDELLLPSLVNSRALFDFFDNYDIWMYPYLNESWWDYIIKTKEDVFDSTAGLKTRREVEYLGFEKCFKILEKKLTND